MSFRPAARVAVIVLVSAIVATHGFSQTAPVAASGVEETTVFAEKSDGYPQFRIPAAVVTPRGTLLVFAEGRTNTRGSQSDGGKIHVVLRRSTDGGRTFEPLQVVVADGENTCGNPCLPSARFS
jgi:sialidase-1